MSGCLFSDDTKPKQPNVTSMLQDLVTQLVTEWPDHPKTYLGHATVKSYWFEV